MFIVFTFLMVRALHECAMINEIDPRNGGSVHFTYSDGASEILPEKIDNLLGKFLI